MTSSQDPVTFSPAPEPPDDGDPEAEAFHKGRWRKHKLIALALGALGGGLASWANSTYGLLVGLPAAAVDVRLFYVAVAVLVAPIVEEHVKLISLVFIQHEEQATYTPRRWMVLGAFAGAGFGLVEAAFYWQALAEASVALANLNLATRLLLGVPFHALAVTASAYGYGLSRHQRNAWPLVRGLAIAILAHAAMNTLQSVPILEAVL